jgi:glycosyltransferase involved in cell wall biosynthesis
MKMLELNEIQSVFTKTKNYARKEFEKKNYEQSLKHIETAAEIAYMFNWIYTDEELEGLLSQISFGVLGEIKHSFVPIEGRVVFYDVFALDNRGLTQQYLRALISWDVEILFVFEGGDLSNSNKIIEEIKAYPKAEFFAVDNSLPRVDKVKIIYNKIVEFKPEKAFLHLHPSSAVAVSVWNSLKEVTRYQVNLTDHAFWLGAKCIDYSLEFRDYGCTVSYEKRDLLESQLLIQPYYPIIDCKSFIGFPSEVTEDNIKIFTGGAYYKMYGRSGMFFDLLKILLDIDVKVVILIAGNGDDKPLKEFVLKNNFEKRIFLLGSRPDITHVFENSDIYLSTYPLTGGLMGQYAAVCSKAILTYTSSDIPCNFSEGFVGWNRSSDFKITHTEINSFAEEAKRLIKDIFYRDQKGRENAKHIISPVEFSENLRKIVTTNVMDCQFVRENINYDIFSEYYLECENKYLKQFNFLIASRFKLKTLMMLPKVIIPVIIDKRFFIKLFNKFF